MDEQEFSEVMAVIRGSIEEIDRVESFWLDASQWLLSTDGTAMETSGMTMRWAALVRCRPQPGRKRGKRYYVPANGWPRTVARVLFNEGSRALLRHPDGPIIIVSGRRFDVP
jgi:hypothetical protein